MGATIIDARKPLPPPERDQEPTFDVDLQLMARVAAGDRAAQCSLAARLSGRVRRVSRTLMRSPADADDVAQAALLEVLRSAGNYRGLSSLERWADGVVVRTASMQLRKRRRSLDHIDYEADIEDVQNRVPEPTGSDDLPRPIHEYLDALPEPVRLALLLRHTFGYSLEEIAELVDTSANAAKKRISRGHQAMRRMIRKDRVLGLHVGEKR
jgi:RNA polymerase sigma-70 factor, ECF subfamily